MQGNACYLYQSMPEALTLIAVCRAWPWLLQPQTNLMTQATACLYFGVGAVGMSVIGRSLPQVHLWPCPIPLHLVPPLGMRNVHGPPSQLAETTALISQPSRIICCSVSILPPPPSICSWMVRYILCQWMRWGARTSECLVPRGLWVSLTLNPRPVRTQDALGFGLDLGYLRRHHLQLER
ncbi:hypothetical protein LZ32DRAFT_212262 [Colletotrichum eremochloae]|nr:hypothetical protein LZ32DRAFT_212262 [Colletotrichum eremochloae]